MIGQLISHLRMLKTLQRLLMITFYDIQLLWVTKLRTIMTVMIMILCIMILEALQELCHKEGVLSRFWHVSTGSVTGLSVRRRKCYLSEGASGLMSWYLFF